MNDNEKLFPWVRFVSEKFLVRWTIGADYISCQGNHVTGCLTSLITNVILRPRPDGSDRINWGLGVFNWMHESLDGLEPLKILFKFSVGHSLGWVWNHHSILSWYVHYMQMYINSCCMHNLQMCHFCILKDIFFQDRIFMVLTIFIEILPETNYGRHAWISTANVLRKAVYLNGLLIMLWGVKTITYMPGIGNLKFQESGYFEIGRRIVLSKNAMFQNIHIWFST